VIRRGAHLVSRFVASLRPGGPVPRDVAWISTCLTASELVLWHQMPAADRRESARVARRVERALAGTAHEADTRWILAAALHDVGKADARLGTVGRALAIMAGAVAGHEKARSWQERGGVARRFALYLRHDEIGADLLRRAGSQAEVVAWAAAHHHPECWPDLVIPLDVAHALARADGERNPRDGD
jgi:putative nucleotidyltransferase with HDIG domain